MIHSLTNLPLAMAFVLPWSVLFVRADYHGQPVYVACINALPPDSPAAKTSTDPVACAVSDVLLAHPACASLTCRQNSCFIASYNNIGSYFQASTDSCICSTSPPPISLYKPATSSTGQCAQPQYSVSRPLQTLRFSISLLKLGPSFPHSVD